MELVRHGFACRDTSQKLYPDRFFHCRVYAKFRESCSRACVLAPSAIVPASVRALHGESTTGLAFSGEADPPKVERSPRRLLNALAYNGPTASRQIVYNARPM